MITEPDIPAPVSHPRKPEWRVPPGSCDAHAHIFGPAERYPYVEDRDYTPHEASLHDYAERLHHLGFERAVLIQPSVYGTDNRLLSDALDQSKQNPFGVSWRGVAVLDETVSDRELEQLDRVGVRGARLNLLNRGSGLTFDNVKRLAERIEPLDWHLQFLIDISKFEEFESKLADLPTVSVIDHFGHFPASMGVGCSVFRELLALMSNGKTWVKLSGPNRVAAQGTPPFDDVLPLAQALVAHMPERLVFGTDWPHVRIPTSMPDDGDLVTELYRWVDGEEAMARQILVDNPAKLYEF